MRFPRIAVVGSGAIGLYYGARLALAGADVRFLMRSDLEAVRARGSVRVRIGEEVLEARSVRACATPEEIGVVDLVIVAAKTTANDAIAAALPRLLDGGTAILTLQNGLGADEFFAARFGEARILGGLAFIANNRTGPGEVTSFHPGSLTLGEFNRPAGDRVRGLAEQFAAAGVETRVAENLASARWHKLVWNVPFNGLSIAAGGVPTDRICSDPALADQARKLMGEVQAAARGLGHVIPDRFLTGQFDVTPPMGAYRPSSLVDFLARREVEVEAIWGEPLRRAEAAGVSCPRLGLLYALLRSLCLVAAFALLLGRAARADSVTSYIDPSVRAQDDFYRHADGLWLNGVRIPPDHARWGTYDLVQDRVDDQLRTLCERASASTGTASAAEKLVGDFYASGMDETAIAENGVEPLRFEFDRIDAMQAAADVWNEIAHLQSLGIPAGLSFGSEIDPKDSNEIIAHLEQGGMGLPVPAYYLDAASAALRSQYQAHVARMLGLLGAEDAQAQQGAAAVLRIETALARASMGPAARRDPDAVYHKLSRAQLAGLAPGLDWAAFLAPLRLGSVTAVDVSQPEFVRALGAELATVPIGDWRAYLRWQVLHHFAGALPGPFVQENFAFYGRILTGAKRPSPRWQQVVRTIDGSIGEALGQLYVEAYFPPAAKADALSLVALIHAALRERLEHLAWMDEATRQRAIAKLDALRVQIGYPDRWRDYGQLSIDRGPYVSNLLKAQAFEQRRQLAKIGRPPDRSEWEMTPPTVNAYYSAGRNELVLPAAILQPPFFDPHGDTAENLGAIGAVIGHELTHGFDDHGRRYGPDGTLQDWWTAESAARFQAQADRIVRQFDGYFVAPGVHLDGRLTEGENIADLGGLKIAFTALERALAGQHPAPVEGCTPQQRFFLNYALMWRVKYRPEAMLLQVKANPHAPGEFRVNGPLSNLEEFARAFAIPPGAPMRRPANERVAIW